MGIWNIFGAGLNHWTVTEIEVARMERKAEKSKQQLALTKRYTKAFGVFKANDAQGRFVWKMGHAIANEQARTIRSEGDKAIGAAKTITREKTQQSIESYAKSLIARSGGNG